MKPIEIGRLLRSSTAGFVAGCRVSQVETPAFGALVRAPLEPDYQIFGLIYDIRINDDGLVRQLVTAEGIDAAIIADNRVNRNVPVEMEVLAVGYQEGERVRHLLPPRPPLSLDVIYQCSAEEVRRFTGSGHFGYFRHVLRAREMPVGELLGAHLEQARAAHTAGGDPHWGQAATQELIALLRDDYPQLMGVLGALADSIEVS